MSLDGSLVGLPTNAMGAMDDEKNELAGREELRGRSR